MIRDYLMEMKVCLFVLTSFIDAGGQHPEARLDQSTYQLSSKGVDHTPGRKTAGERPAATISCDFHQSFTAALFKIINRTCPPTDVIVRGARRAR